VIVNVTVNGEQRSANVSGSESLLTMLRDELRLAGSKNACEEGECGSCSVLLDGQLVCSCLVMAADADGSTVMTVEGVAGGSGAVHPVQHALLEAGATQCGFCTPGFVMAIVDLLDRDPHPGTADIGEALAGNVCRCTGYGSIVRAVQRLADHAGREG
jgi:aerobic carbon-monoxide dehydrogenase small subunit